MRYARPDQWPLQRCGTESPCLVFPADLDNDREPAELVGVEMRHKRTLLALGRTKGGDWKEIGGQRFRPGKP
jgi:hypothetical protein